VLQIGQFVADLEHAVVPGATVSHKRVASARVLHSFVTRSRVATLSGAASNVCWWPPSYIADANAAEMWRGCAVVTAM